MASFNAGARGCARPLIHPSEVAAIQEILRSVRLRPDQADGRYSLGRLDMGQKRLKRKLDAAQGNKAATAAWETRLAGMNHLISRLKACNADGLAVPQPIRAGGAAPATATPAPPPPADLGTPSSATRADEADDIGAVPETAVGGLNGGVTTNDAQVDRILAQLGQDPDNMATWERLARLSEASETPSFKRFGAFLWDAMEREPAAAAATAPHLVELKRLAFAQMKARHALEDARQALREAETTRNDLGIEVAMRKIAQSTTRGENIQAARSKALQQLKAADRPRRELYTRHNVLGGLTPTLTAAMKEPDPLQPGLPADLEVTWLHSFFRTAEIRGYANDNGLGTGAILVELLQHPYSMLLQSLTVGPPDEDPSGSYDWLNQLIGHKVSPAQAARYRYLQTEVEKAARQAGFQAGERAAAAVYKAEGIHPELPVHHLARLYYAPNDPAKAWATVLQTMIDPRDHKALHEAARRALSRHGLEAAAAVYRDGGVVVDPGVLKIAEALYDEVETNPYPGPQRARRTQAIMAVFPSEPTLTPAIRSRANQANREASDAEQRRVRAEQSGGLRLLERQWDEKGPRQLPCIKRFRIGDLNGEEPNNHHEMGHVGVALRAMPNLEELVIQGSHATLGDDLATSIAALERLTRLRKLTVIADGADANFVEAVRTAQPPNLEERTVRIGHAGEEGDEA